MLLGKETLDLKDIFIIHLFTSHSRIALKKKKKKTFGSRLEIPEHSSMCPGKLSRINFT